MKNSRALVVIPTYNERANIERLLTEVLSQRSSLDVLVVDDNSPDGTGHVVKALSGNEPRLKLISRKMKSGLGGAYIAGMTWGLERDYASIVQMDADFSHDPTDVPRLLDELNSHDVAVGCRYMPKGRISGWSWGRNALSRGGNWYAMAILALPLFDLTTGFAAWHAETLRRLALSKLQSRGYAFQIELKYRATLAGARIVEIPIHFRDRSQGKSKMSGSIVREAVLGVLKMRANRAKILSEVTQATPESPPIS